MLKPNWLNLKSENLKLIALVSKESQMETLGTTTLRYVKDQQYPEFANDNDNRTLRRLAMGFFLDGDILYKKSKDQMLLRCVDIDEAKKIVHKIHEGICGTHASGHVMAR